MKKTKDTAGYSAMQPLMNPAPKRILVPLDFSEPSKRAACFAREWARQFGARVYLLTVVEPPTFMAGMDEVPIAVGRGELPRQAKAALEKFAQQEFPAEVPVTVLVSTGKAYEEIVAAAQNLNIELIIIPTNGHQGLKRAVLGSTAERVVRFAPCPVLTVRRRNK